MDCPLSASVAAHRDSSARRRIALAPRGALARAVGRPIGGSLSLHLPWPTATIDPHRIDDATAAILGDALFEPLYALGRGGRDRPRARRVRPGADPRRPPRRAPHGRPHGARSPHRRARRRSPRSRARARSARAAGSPSSPRPASTGEARSSSRPTTPRSSSAPSPRPLVAIVPASFSPDRPDGTGPFRADRRGDALVLARSPRAADGPAFLDEVVVHASPDLAAPLRAFEAGEDAIGWLGSGLHEPRPGAKPFDFGAVAWAILRTGHEAGTWDAPGIAQRIADGIAYSRVAYLVLGRAVAVAAASKGGAGRPCDLLVRDDAPWLVELAKAVAATIARPAHEVTARPVPRRGVRPARGRPRVLAPPRRRPPARPDAARSVRRPRDRRRPGRPPPTSPRTRRASIDGAARTLTRTMRIGVVGEVRVQGAHMPDVDARRLAFGGASTSATRRASRRTAMRLAPRLILSFGVLAAVSSAGLGLALREDRRRDETERFDSEVRSACARVASEVARQAEADRKLVAGACQAGELVDRALVAIDSGELDARRLALAALVPKEREAFDLDELILVADPGDVLGADPRALLGTPRGALEGSLARRPVGAGSCARTRSPRSSLGAADARTHRRGRRARRRAPPRPLARPLRQHGRRRRVSLGARPRRARRGAGALRHRRPRGDEGVDRGHQVEGRARREPRARSTAPSCSRPSPPPAPRSSSPSSSRGASVARIEELAREARKVAADQARPLARAWLGRARRAGAGLRPHARRPRASPAAASPPRAGSPPGARSRVVSRTR